MISTQFVSHMDAVARHFVATCEITVLGDSSTVHNRRSGEHLVDKLNVGVMYHAALNKLDLNN